MFILSLAIADLIVGLIVMPISSAYVLTGDWIFGIMVCQFWLVIDYTASTASIFNLLILSLDRYWSIRSPLKYLCKRTKKRALAMIGVVWLLAASWVLPIMGWHRVVGTGERKHADDVCETEFSDNVLFKLTTSAINFIIPMTLMVVLYIKIYREIKRRGKFDIGRCSVSGSACNEQHSAKGTSLSPIKGHKEACKETKGDAKASSGSASHNATRRTAFWRRRSRATAEPGQKRQCATPLHEYVEPLALPQPVVIEPVDACLSETSLSCPASEPIGGSLSASASVTARLEPVEHYKQLTLVKPGESVNFAREDFRDVVVEVEYIAAAGKAGASIAHAAPANKKRASPRSSYSQEGTSHGSASSLPPKELGSLGEQWMLSPTETNGQAQCAVAVSTNKKTKKEKKSSAPNSKNAKPVKARRSKMSCCADKSRTESLSRISNDSFKSAFKSVTKGHALSGANHHQHALRRVESSRLRQEKKAARQLGVILGAFILCWLPYITVFIVTAYCSCISHSVHTIAIWLGYLNSTINPFLYSLLNDNFKQAFRKLLGRGGSRQPFDTVARGASFRVSRSNFA